MKAMTVRGINPSMDKRLQDLARKQGKGINQVIPVKELVQALSVGLRTETDHLSTGAVL